MSQGDISLAGSPDVGNLQLPGGTFLVNATALAFASGLTAGDTVTCWLTDGLTLVYGGATLVPDPAGFADQSIAITAATTVGGPMTITCGDDTGQAFVQSVSMTAIPVGTLQASALAAQSGRHAPPLPAAGRAPGTVGSPGANSAHHP